MKIDNQWRAGPEPARICRNSGAYAASSRLALSQLPASGCMHCTPEYCLRNALCDVMSWFYAAVQFQRWHLQKVTSSGPDRQSMAQRAVAERQKANSHPQQKISLHSAAGSAAAAE
ncbi:hypothetical protein EVAR_7226_1 [Eumeta japonica]|uniref:Uncharacterized protein n=1 Tax=Eumeta variegata TaxID=151549 RepID=A0A4C1T583_EUMVA|nr:hypothetical protein EVAR_7226_1 [Eumeta japonica]